jgi:transcription-repair coupling factor (superfamily II helicase)
LDLNKDKTVRAIAARLADHDPAQGPVSVSGTWGSFAPMLAAHLWKILKRPVLYIAPHIDDADAAADDLQVFAGTPVQTLPVWESPDEVTDATDEILAQRLRTSLWMASQQQSSSPERFLLATCVQALNQPVARPSLLAQQGLSLAVGQSFEPHLLAGWLTDHNFERVDSIDLPGQFAHRGGIVDIFAPVCSVVSQKKNASDLSEPRAIRIEFFGDQVESIRTINLDTQLSGDALTSVQITASQTSIDPESTELFLNLLPAETLIVLDGPVETAEVSEVFLSRLENPVGMYPWRAVYQAMQKYSCLQVSRFAAAQSEFQLDVTSAQQFEHKSGAIWKDQQGVLAELLHEAQTRQVHFYCESPAEVQRMRQIIGEKHARVPENFKLLTGFVHRGFIVNALDTIVITHHEVFGQVSVRRRIRRIQSVSSVDSLLDLKKGDYVVHITYGIGKFVGIQMMEKAHTKAEYITLEYADKVQIHVPVANIHLIQKFIGSTPKRPPLSKIGTKRWEKQKENVAQGVEEMAAELLGGAGQTPESRRAQLRPRYHLAARVRRVVSLPGNARPDYRRVADQGRHGL